MAQMKNTDTRATNENSSRTNHQNVRCGIWGRTFRTNHGLLQHLNFCQRQNNDLQQTVIEPKVRNIHSCDEGNKVTGSRFEALIHDAYENIVQWKSDIFMLPTGASGKTYINETTRLFDVWVNDTPYESITLNLLALLCDARFIISKTK